MFISNSFSLLTNNFINQFLFSFSKRSIIKSILMRKKIEKCIWYERKLKRFQISEFDRKKTYKISGIFGNKKFFVEFVNFGVYSSIWVHLITPFSRQIKCYIRFSLPLYRTRRIIRRKKNTKGSLRSRKNRKKMW